MVPSPTNRPMLDAERSAGLTRSLRKREYGGEAWLAGETALNKGNNSGVL